MRNKKGLDEKSDYSELLNIMAMIRKLSTDEIFTLKHKKIFKETLGVDIDKKEKASLKSVYKHADLYAKEKIFDPKDVEVYKKR